VNNNRYDGSATISFPFYNTSVEGIPIRQIFELETKTIQWQDGVLNATDKFHKFDKQQLSDELYTKPFRGGDQQIHLKWEGELRTIPSSKGGLLWEL